LHLGWILGTPIKKVSLSSSSMYPFAYGVFIYVVWRTTTFACLMESFLLYFLEKVTIEHEEHGHEM
jgi:hypothetical protein